MPNKRYKRVIARGLWIRTGLTALVYLAVSILSTPSAGAQDESSLGDLARQTRQEHALKKQQELTPAAKDTNRLASELEQEQEEVGAAPDGFQSYSSDGYRLWVPSSSTIQGRDETGVLLATADVTGITTKVFAVHPISVVGHPSETEFQELARRFWQPYGSISCETYKPGSLSHYCSLYGTVFGNQFRGQARFVEGENRIVPVVCFATVLPSEDVDFGKARTGEERAQMSARAYRNMDRRAMSVYSDGLCKTVLNSIRLKEDSPRLSGETDSAHAHRTPMPFKTTAAGESSLGDVARASKHEIAGRSKAKFTVEAENSMDNAPSGFRVHSETRCIWTCWQESFFLPENARHVRGGNSDKVYVAMLDEQTSVVIYFGTTDVTYGYSEYGRAQQVARNWIHAQKDSSAKEIRIDQTINARAVPIVRSRLIAEMNTWMEEDAEIGTDGVHMSMGCIAREDRFADAELLCSIIFESWRLRRQ